MELFEPLAHVKSKLSDIVSVEVDNAVLNFSRDVHSFKDLGLVDWICQSTSAMGFRRPTEIQGVCIPSILKGKDVLGCAETGSGKTAAFALPILQDLSKDLYGIFAIVLTPTRELAIQITEQFAVLGNALGLRICLIIGGANMMAQGRELYKRPHIVIATPGRLRHHLEGADPPDISKAKYLVLDEADRLLSTGFASELQVIISRMSDKRQTLLFSATMTSSLEELEKIAVTNKALRFDLTETQKLPATLIQEYLFMPVDIKTAYLATLLSQLIHESTVATADEDDENIDKTKELMLELEGKSSASRLSGKSNKLKKKLKNRLKHKQDELIASTKQLSYSIIVFVSTCQRCHEIHQTLLEFGVDSVSLHGLMSQSQRIASLGKFKSLHCRVLIATDVASRGLDIPTVDLVINMDIPKVTADYVHRVGRTARVGRVGKAISFVTPNDVDIVHAIEAYIGKQLELSTLVDVNDVVKQLNAVSKAKRIAKQKMLEAGFDEHVEVFAKRKKEHNLSVQRKRKTDAHDTDIHTTDNN